MKKVAIVFGSSRSNGNTMIATKQIMEKINHSLEPLAKLQKH